MQPEALLKDRVGRLQRRLRWLVAQRCAVIGLAAASVVACLMAAAAQLHWAPNAVDFILPVLAAGALAGFLYGLTRRISSLAAARLADQRLDLKERLSTAVALAVPSAEHRTDRSDRTDQSDAADAPATGAGSPTRSPLLEVQLSDAAAHAESLRPGQVFPWRLPREARYCAATLVLLLGIVYLPALPFFHSQKERAEAEAIQAAGRDYQHEADRIERRRTGDPTSDEVVARVAQNLRQLGRDQQRGRLTKKEALLRASEMRQTLEKAGLQFGMQPESKSVEQAAEELRKAAERQGQQGDPKTAQALQRASESLRQGDLDGAQQQLDQLAEQLKQAGRTGASAEQMRQASEALRQTANAMEGSRADSAKTELRDGAQKLADAAAKMEQLQKQMAQAKSGSQRQELDSQMRETSKSALSEAAT